MATKKAARKGVKKAAKKSAAKAAGGREPDWSAFPAGTVAEYRTLLCLACIFDIFTGQLGVAPRTAYTEIRRLPATS